MLTFQAVILVDSVPVSTSPSTVYKFKKILELVVVITVLQVRPQNMIFIKTDFLDCWNYFCATWACYAI